MRFSGVKDIADLLLALYSGKLYARRFVVQPTLKTKFNCRYNYQRALCEDPEVISKWFALVCNIIAKYRIQENDVYNFDKTSFIIRVITISIVVTRSKRHSKAKTI